MRNRPRSLRLLAATAAAALASLTVTTAASAQDTDDPVYDRSVTCDDGTIIYIKANTALRIAGSISDDEAALCELRDQIGGFEDVTFVIDEQARAEAQGDFCADGTWVPSPHTADLCRPIDEAYYRELGESQGHICADGTWVSNVHPAGDLCVDIDRRYYESLADDVPAGYDPVDPQQWLATL